MHRRNHSSLRSWLIFIATAVALSVIGWVAWSVIVNHDVLPRGDSAHSNSTITIGLTDAPASLDIRSDADPAVERALLGNVYETLVTRDNANALQPGLAASWTVSEDGLSYTFTLHDGLRFSNGDELDSSDVVWSLQQTVEHQYQGADGLSNLGNVANPDPLTVTITLNHTDPTLLRTLSGRAGIVYDSQAEPSATSATGSGPFTVDRYDAGSTLTFTRNASYWGEEADAAAITLRYYDDANAMVTALRDGELDMALPEDKSAAAAVMDDPSLTVQTGSSNTKVILALNNDGDSVFSDVQARNAVQYAVDKESIASAQADSAGAIGGPLSPLEPGYEDLTGMHPYDPDTARSMIAYFAGGASYFGTIDFVVPQRYEALGSTVSEQLQAVGLDVAMEVVDEATLSQRIADGQYTIALTVTSGVNDAAVFGTSDNVFRYTSGSAQEAYSAALDATNDERWRTLLSEYAKTVANESPCDWLYTRNTTIMASSQISGYPTNMTDQYLPLAGIVKQ